MPKPYQNNVTATHRSESLIALIDLVEQLDGIGVADWHGAEGLDLTRARDVIAEETGDR